jgi:hypothetical protein
MDQLTILLDYTLILHPSVTQSTATCVRRIFGGHKGRDPIGTLSVQNSAKMTAVEDQSIDGGIVVLKRKSWIKLNE